MHNKLTPASFKGKSRLIKEQQQQNKNRMVSSETIQCKLIKADKRSRSVPLVASQAYDYQVLI